MFHALLPSALDASEWTSSVKGRFTHPPLHTGQKEVESQILGWPLAVCYPYQVSLMYPHGQMTALTRTVGPLCTGVNLAQKTHTSCERQNCPLVRILKPLVCNKPEVTFVHRSSLTEHSR